MLLIFSNRTWTFLGSSSESSAGYPYKSYMRITDPTYDMMSRGPKYDITNLNFILNAMSIPPMTKLATKVDKLINADNFFTGSVMKK